MRIRFLAPIGFAAIASALSIPSIAHAQRTGFGINRFEPAERGSQFFVNDTLDFRGKSARPAIGATLDYAYKPLVVYDLNGNERSAVVRHQVFTHLGGSLVVGERLRVGLNLPLAIYQDGETSDVRIGTTDLQLRGADKAAIGDVRLALDLRLAGEKADACTHA
jgi:hypothetical protein